MRVLHVLESLAAGGVETTFLNVLKHLPASITSDVLAFSGGALEAEYRDSTAHLDIASSRADIDRIVVDGHYDVAYVLFERCAARVLPSLLTRTATAVIYGKNYDFSGQWRTTEGFQDQSDDSMMAACDGVTFTTPSLADGYGEDERSRGVVLGKGANVTPLLDLPPADEATPDRILVIANPNPRKRIGDLIAALAIVRQHIPTAELHVIGRGDPIETARLQQVARDLDISHAVTLAGVSRDVAGELRASRVIALASGNEGVPTALLEGMAAARPVVTTDAGHVQSIITDGVEGYIVPIGAIDQLASRLTALLGDRPLATTMGTAGRERARGHAVERIADRLGAFLISQVQ